MASIRAGGPYRYGLDPDSDVGGEVYERRLLERLPAHGVDLVLGMPRDLPVPDPPPEWVIDELAPARELHWTAAPRRFVPYVVRLLRAGRVDLLRGHSVRYCGPSLLIARRLVGARTPIVLHHHHLSARWARLEVRILSAADLVIAVSAHARDELVGAGVPAERIRVIVQGVARPPATCGWPAAWPEPGSGPGPGLRLLAVGRLESRKRPQLAVEAVAGLRARGVEASLVIAGGGPLAAALAARARALGVEGEVRIVGRVSDADKWRLYDSADVLVFTSELEGFGIVVAEAQARGVPVLATEGTAAIEAFAPGRSGLLAAPTGAALAEALARLADPEVRGAMAAAAREHAARFDWDRCAAEVAEAYRELVPAVRRAR